MSGRDWLSGLTESMIRRAMTCPEGAEYAGDRLSFIEDALDISGGTRIFRGNSAKESAVLFSEAMHQDIPERGAFVFTTASASAPTVRSTGDTAASASLTEGASMHEIQYGSMIIGRWKP